MSIIVTPNLSSMFYLFTFLYPSLAHVHPPPPLSPPLSISDVPDREEVFVKKAAAFQKHSKSMADTAAALAKSGAVTDKKMADDLIRTAAKVEIASSIGE